MLTETRGRKERFASIDERVSGPHWAANEHTGGYTYFRCEECGAEAVSKKSLLGCCDR